MAKRLALGVSAALIALVLVTYALGEVVEGAVLYTRDEAGALHATKLWVVDHAGAPWVRVARPERRWFERLEQDARVELERGGERRAYRAIPHREPEARAAIDAAFRAKNGAIDWWYGVVLRSHAIPVELVPAE